MNITVKIFLLLCCCSMGLFAQDTLSVDSTLKNIEMFYNSAQYVTAEIEARRLYEETTISDSAKVQCEKWIAFSLIAQGKSLLARDRFVSLLTMNPDFDLDPILTSPKILSVFYDAKTKYSLKQKALPAAGTGEILSSQHVTYRTIIFPGWEQLYQGRAASGSIFLGAGIATLGAGVAFELLRSGARDDYLKATVPSDISTKYNSYNTYRKAEVYSFVAFALVYVASEIDVFSHSNLDSKTISFHQGNSLPGTTSVGLTINF